MIGVRADVAESVPRRVGADPLATAPPGRTANVGSELPALGRADDRSIGAALGGAAPAGLGIDVAASGAVRGTGAPIGASDGTRAGAGGALPTARDGTARFSSGAGGIARPVAAAGDGAAGEGAATEGGAETPRASPAGAPNGTAGGIEVTAGGVGRRPGANGGTRVGVTLRGAPAGGVARPAPADCGGCPSASRIGARAGSGATGGRSTATAAPPAPGRALARAIAAVRLAASCGVAKSSVQLRAAEMGMMPPHTEQRARTSGPGTRAGSTRNTDWHSGHETFMTRRPG